MIDEILEYLQELETNAINESERLEERYGAEDRGVLEQDAIVLTVQDIRDFIEKVVR